MARTKATLGTGPRITDFVSLGVVAKTFPQDRVDAVLARTGKASLRHRDLPARVVVYYVIAMAMYMSVSTREVLRCLLEGVRWLAGPLGDVRVAGKSGISQARTRLTAAPVRELFEEVVGPISEARTKGAWYRKRLLVSLDGSTLDVADTRENAVAFGYPGSSRGRTAFPQLRLVSLVEGGTHVLFGTRMGANRIGEISLAQEVIGSLRAGMLCLADRNFFGYPLWKAAQATEADLLWRAKKNLRLPCVRRWADGSYESVIYPSDKDRRRGKNGLAVRVIEYRLEGVNDAEPFYRLITTILDPNKAPAEELAALYPERWEIETSLDELKTHLRGARIILRSKTPELVRQEFYGLLLAHFAVRGLMHEAALRADEDPDRLSFTHTVCVLRRKLPLFAAIPPGGPKTLS